MRPEAAYVVSAADGMYVDATQAALELLRTDIQGLKARRVGDFSPPGGRETMNDLLAWTRRNPGLWRTGITEILRTDGWVVAVRFAAIRRPKGQLVMRLEADGAANGVVEPAVSDVLEAWRQKARELAELTPGTDEFVLAEAEVEWLNAEYQRLFAAKSEEHLHSS
jgi:hypothetical protein